MSGASPRWDYQDTEGDDDSERSSDRDSAYDGAAGQLAIADREEALVQAAMQRIQRARDKGKSDVKLDKDELAALQRRKKRMEEEAERRKRGSGSSSDRKKRKDQRIAVPLSQLEPISRKKTRQPKEPPPRKHSAHDRPEKERQVYPPMGYFPPPSSSRSRPRAGTNSASQRPPSRAQDERGSSPFSYDYVQRPPSANRHVVSDSAGRPPSSRGYPAEQGWLVQHAGDASGNDPFRYQTAGPRAPYPTGAAAASRRYVSNPPQAGHPPPRGMAPAAARGQYDRREASRDDETSEEDSETSDDDDEESTSDDLGNGAQIRQPARGRGQIVVEVSPEREPAKKKSSGSSPVKRKPVPSSRGSRRRKK